MTDGNTPDQPGQPGLDALVEAWIARRGGVEPVMARVGVSELDPPIEAVACWPSGDHWLFVTCGLSDLAEKTTDDATWSGFGIEFTFRLRHPDPDGIPPEWPLRMLVALAGTVWDGTTYNYGDRIITPSPLGGATEATTLTSALVLEDPELARTSTPNGDVLLLTVVGVTTEEAQGAQDPESVAALVERLRDGNPLLMTDPRPPTGG